MALPESKLVIVPDKVIESLSKYLDLSILKTIESETRRIDSDSSAESSTTLKVVDST